MYKKWRASVNMGALRTDLSEYLDQLVIQYPAVRYSLEGEADAMAVHADAADHLVAGTQVVVLIMLDGHMDLPLAF